MTKTTHKTLLMLGLAATGWLCNGSLGPNSQGSLIATAQAVIGRPATPMSYAGVARRTTVRAVTPGVGAPGVGVTPRPGVGVNRGGPVNRVGVR